ncbi:MAG: DUF2332 domain-containing protein [Nocardioidaceae bacterium]
MVRFDAGTTLAERMRAHAGEATHLYGHLMRAMADDWEAGGPVREICRDWEDAPTGAVVQLRLLAGLFRIVLTGRAPQLEPFYPCLGGEAPPDSAWPVARPVLGAHRHELRDALAVAPQTNEAGRSTALLVGVFAAVRRSGLRRVRLLEPGASAGLNLLVDQFLFVNAEWTFGPAHSPLALHDAVVGDPQPIDFAIVDRRGCDLEPVDASTPEGQLRLRSFVWPFDVARHQRLTAALQVAAEHPVTIDRERAARWLQQQLAEPPTEDVLTVIWQSITKLYWPPEEVQEVEKAIRAARHTRPVAHIAMEFPDSTGRGGASLTVDLGEDGEIPVASVADHGIPVTLAPVAA